MSQQERIAKLEAAAKKYDEDVKRYLANAAFLEEVAKGDQICFNAQRTSGEKTTPIQYTFQPTIQGPSYPCRSDEGW